ncbi:hypothetical protein [Methylotenera sp. G11]|uniref:hypothetical protein n=1 Tax=Methylotenera sp. G11 TaxID=1506585 RepID=UPI000648BDA4|nr:hypothetical protein [Methylotenera sp. G11]
MAVEEMGSQSKLNEITKLMYEYSGSSAIASWISIDSKNGHLVLAETGQLDGKTINPQQHFGELSKKITEYIAEQNAIIERIKETTQQTSHPEVVMGESNGYAIGDQLRWYTLNAQLQASGAHVTVVGDGTSGLHGTIWPRDRYVATPNGAQIYPQGDMKTEVEVRSSGVQEAMKKDFTKQGIFSVVTDGFLEGGDVLQDPKSNTVYVGVYVDLPHSSHPEFPILCEQEKAATNLAKELNMNLIVVPKTGFHGNEMPDDYYHLDTFMSVLPDGGVILIPSATTPEVAEIIERRAKGDRYASYRYQFGYGEWQRILCQLQ